LESNLTWLSFRFFPGKLGGRNVSGSAFLNKWLALSLRNKWLACRNKKCRRLGIRRLEFTCVWVEVLGCVLQLLELGLIVSVRWGQSVGVIVGVWESLSATIVVLILTWWGILYRLILWVERRGLLLVVVRGGRVRLAPRLLIPLHLGLIVSSVSGGRDSLRPILLLGSILLVLGLSLGLHTSVGVEGRRFNGKWYRSTIKH